MSGPPPDENEIASPTDQRRWAHAESSADTECSSGLEYRRSQLQLAEMERDWLSHELHDGLVQWVVGAKLQLEAMHAKSLQHPQPIPPSEIQYVLTMLSNALKESRQLMAGLRSPELEQSDWLTLLRHWLEVVTTDDSPNVYWELDSNQISLSNPMQQCVYRIAQESIGNALRHSKASRIDISTKVIQGRFHLTVRDDGNGFTPNQVASDRYGLKGMHKRSVLIGGELSIESTPGIGTCVTAILPLKA